jgi:hypothetical protein
MVRSEKQAPMDGLATVRLQKETLLSVFVFTYTPTLILDSYRVKTWCYYVWVKAVRVFLASV